MQCSMLTQFARFLPEIVFNVTLTGFFIFEVLSGQTSIHLAAGPAGSGL